MPLTESQTSRQWALPPLILHPFSDQTTPKKLVRGSRASLMLQGLIPSTDSGTLEDLNRTLLEGRYCEITMLYYVGKDVMRWIDQCLEYVAREPGLAGANLPAQSFARLLIDHPPPGVEEKLRRWGVADFKAIFSRALGLKSIFAYPPEFESLTPEFLRHYYRYADHLFHCLQGLAEFDRIEHANFPFELYSSGEYTSLLERQWAQ